MNKLIFLSYIVQQVRPIKETLLYGKRKVSWKDTIILSKQAKK